MSVNIKKKQIIIEIINQSLDEIKKQTGLILDVKINDRSIDFYDDCLFDESKRLNFEIIETIVIDSLKLQSKISKRRLSTISKKRDIVDARKIFCYICHKYKYRFVDIAKYINKHHTSITYLSGECKNLLKTDDVFKEKYTVIFNKIKDIHDKTV